MSHEKPRGELKVKFVVKDKGGKVIQEGDTNGKR